MKVKMELKTRFQYTYFLHTFVINESKYAKYILKLLKEGDLILDFGCGSGRDTKYFIEKEKNMKVDAIDGSVELCKIAQKYTGINVRHMLF